MGENVRIRLVGETCKEAYIENVYAHFTDNYCGVMRGEWHILEGAGGIEESMEV